jgi:hypothetical protein
VEILPQDIRGSMPNSEQVKQGFTEYIEKIPEGHESYFGFNERSEFKIAKLGRPYNIYVINYEALEIESEALIETNLWYVPVFINEEIRCFLKVRVEDPEFRVVGIGLKEVAYDVNHFEQMEKNIGETNNAMIIDEMSNIYVMLSNTGKYTTIRDMSRSNMCDSQSFCNYDKSSFITILKERTMP